MKKETNPKTTLEDNLRNFPPSILWTLLILWNILLIFLLKFSTSQIAEFIVKVTGQTPENAFSYTIALEVIIFLVTATGRSGAANWFIFISITSQLLSMHKWDVLLPLHKDSAPQVISDATGLFTGSLIVAVMAAIGIHFVSKQIKATIHVLITFYRTRKGKTPEQYEQVLAAQQDQLAAEQELRAAAEQRAAGAQQLAAAIENKSAGTEQLNQKLQQVISDLETKVYHYENPKFECPECGKDDFKTAAALNGHMRLHKKEEVNHD